MKLTENTLREMVKEILKEDEMPFPPPPDQESVESAEQSLDHDQDIIEFFENEDACNEGCDDEDVIMGEDDVSEDLDLNAIVQEEISRYIKKKYKL